MTGTELAVGIFLGVLLLMGLRALYVVYITKDHDVDTNNFGDK